LKNIIDDSWSKPLYGHPSEAIIIINQEGLIIHQSQEFTILFNLNFKCQFVQDLLRRIYLDDKAALLKLIDVSGKQNECSFDPFRIIDSHEKIKWVKASSYNLLKINELNGIIITFLELCPPAKHPELGDLKNKLYYSCFYKHFEGLLILNKDLKIHEANESFANKLGYSVMEIQNLEFLNLLSPLAVEQVYDILKTLVSDEPIHFELEHGHKQGNILAFYVTARLFELGGEAYSMLMYSDFSERWQIEEALKESEKKYKNIVNNLIDIYYRTDLSGNLIMVSPSCLETFGYSNMDEVLGKSIELLYPDKEERLTFLEMLSTSGKVVNYRTKLLKKNGEEVYVETTSNPLFDFKGNCIGVEGIVRDITDRMLAEQALKKSESRLRELNATKDKLFSIIAHDLKSPFSSIIGFSELISENFESLSSDEIKEYIKHIDISAKNTLSLLDNLLIWAKTQTGQMVFKPICLNFKNILEQVTSVANPSALIKNISISYLNPEDMIVFADYNMLQTILRNLISNAIKFTGPGGRIEIISQVIEGFVEIIISDNGIGMDEKSLETLFKIDKSVINTGTAKESGSGLGLLICIEFVEKHGGRIWAESATNIGSAFHFTLPLKAPDYSI
jgi:PAS domain S-box-containing protein